MWSKKSARVGRILDGKILGKIAQCGDGVEGVGG